MLQILRLVSVRHSCASGNYRSTLLMVNLSKQVNSADNDWAAGGAERCGEGGCADQGIRHLLGVRAPVPGACLAKGDASTAAYDPGI